MNNIEQSVEDVGFAKDFGVVSIEATINKEEFECRTRLKEFMKNLGYNTERCDICSVQARWYPGEVDIHFKFVNVSTPTMATEPYYRIVFKEKVKKTQSYLVIWQFDKNELSREETPIDVQIDTGASAYAKFHAIRAELLRGKTYMFKDITIVGIFRL